MNAGRAAGRGPELAAVLIVKDEAEDLPGCLASLAGTVEEIVVYDTGSQDGTQRLAVEAGARVVQGYWDDDFARARNAALESTGAPWVLSIDADERVVLGPNGVDGLRRALADPVDGFSVWIRSVGPGSTSADTAGLGLGTAVEHQHQRLIRPAAVRWHRPVHEVPIRHDGTEARLGDLDREVLRIEHLGYVSAELVRIKGLRNVAIAQAEVDRLATTAHPDPAAVVKAALDLGRSCQAAGRLQQAVDAFETVRHLVPGSRPARVATDALAAILLENGHADAVPVLAADLLGWGVEPAYCALLNARAALAGGRPDEALALVRHVGAVTDGAGRYHDGGLAADLRLQAAAAAGRPDDAAAALIDSMVTHGRVAGRGRLLLEVFAAQSPEVMSQLLDGAGGRHRQAIAEELDLYPEPGPSWSRALRAPAG